MIVIKKSLQNKLDITVPFKYLKPYQNRHSNAIDVPIQVIFEGLFRQYGCVTPEELAQEEQKLRSQIFVIIEPIVTLFNEIKDLQELAEAARLLYSDEQVLTLGIHSIKNMNDFEKDLIDWYDKPIVQQTWANFQTHFSTTQEKL